MKTVKFFLASALCVLMSTACGGTKKAPLATPEGDQVADPVLAANEAPSGTVAGAALVVYFSHAGENYAVGDVKVGNTKLVADYITELVGADQFEIVTHKYDGMAYQPLCDLAKEEQQRGELPPFEGDPGDLSQYTTVFVGGPVWWGTWPQVMFTFFSRHDLNGKTLIPFTTHEGSGLGRCVDDLRKAYPQATVKGAFSMYGHDVRGGKPQVEAWLKGLAD